MIDMKKILHGARLAAVLAAALAISACANKTGEDAQANAAGRQRLAASKTSWSMSATAYSSKRTRPNSRRSHGRPSTSRPSGSRPIANMASSPIEGHADERGTREYNIALGARRAQAVRDYLTSRGIQAQRMRTISYGKERPVAVCNDISCWSQNRRAVTVLGASS